MKHYQKLSVITRTIMTVSFSHVASASDLQNTENDLNAYILNSRK